MTVGDDCEVVLSVVNEGTITGCEGILRDLERSEDTVVVRSQGHVLWHQSVQIWIHFPVDELRQTIFDITLRHHTALRRIVKVRYAHIAIRELEDLETFKCVIEEIWIHVQNRIAVVRIHGN